MSERIDQIDALKRSFQACAQVQQCYCVAGECDVVLFFGTANVKRFKTLVAMNRVKVGLEVPTAG